MLVKDLLNSRKKRPVECINVASTLLDVSQKLQDDKVGALLVVDDLNNIRGIVSERDLVHAIVDFKADVVNTGVATVMTEKVISCTTKDDMMDALSVMNQHYIRHILVKDDEAPVAMLSIREFEYACRLLQQDARTDSLTGLNNRRYILELLEKEFQRSRRTDMPLSVALLDIDNFKFINDNYGHHAGDQVLCELGQIMLQQMRTYDIVGRVGGEEFVIVFPATDVAEGKIACERLLKVVRSYLIELESASLSFTASIGLTAIFPEAIDAGCLLKKADKLLYHAKENGRDRVETTMLFDLYDNVKVA